MAHVGIKRLAAGDGQEDAAEDQQGKARLFDEHAGAIPRIEGQEDFKVIEDVDEAMMPRVTNQSSVTGAKSEATPAVPLYWNTNSVMRMASVSGTTTGLKPSLMT